MLMIFFPKVNNIFCTFILFKEKSNDPDIFEGDIILTPEQRAAVESGQRASITTGKWPGGVLVYTIDSSLGKLMIELPHFFADV